MSDYKQRVLRLAEDLYAGVITYRQFFDSLPSEVWDGEDAEIEELVDMITHEPHVGWFLGVSKEQGQKNRAEIRGAIERLRQRLGR